MRISRAAAHNAKGFQEFDQTFGDVNLISGRNGNGKSSVLDILCAAFVTDGSRNLLKSGEEEGWLLVVLEDEGDTFEIRRTLTPGKVSEPTIKSSKTGKVGAYARFIKEIVDTATLDPIRKVMTASTKEQLAILLETLPFELEPGAIATAVAGCLPPDVLSRTEKLPALDAIKAAYDHIYSDRRDTNRDAKKARIQAQQLRESLTGAADGADWGSVAGALLEQIQKLAAREARDREAAERQYGEAKKVLAERFARSEREIDADIDAQIAALNEQRRQRKEALASQKETKAEELASGHRANLDGIAEAVRPERERLTSEHAAANERAGREAADARTKANAEANEQEAASLESKSEAMTGALKSLDGVREKLLEKLPIKGLEIRGGVAYLDGVPLEEKNTAERAIFWIRVAVLRAMNKDLGVVVIDDAEHFDDINFPILVDAAKRSGLQFFISRVAPHEFQIETV
ncbi:MAG: hypothetical protein LLG20_18655 [Acidobacteriales bacterium]|nr:hypothetical protein [Terriglobales bacterium]